MSTGSSGGQSPRAPARVATALSAASPAERAAAVLAVASLALAAAVRPGLFLDQAIGGLVYGMILVMVSLGLSLILGLMGIVNFAHGALFMLGAYFSYTVVAMLGLSFWAALVVAPVAVGLVGVLLEVSVLRRLYAEEPIIGLLATFGLTLMIEESVRAAWGAAPLAYDVPAPLATSTDLVVTQVGTFRLFTVAVSAVAVVAVYLLITRTDFGLTVRAGVQDDEMAGFLGVNLPVRFTAMFFLGAVIAGLGGVLQAAEFGMGPEMDRTFVILAFVVVVVGGVGSLFGSVVAGLLVGEATFLASVVLESLATVTGVAALDVEGIGGLVPFLVMIAVLLWRPRGLFGEEGFLE
ncbi:branched-chain amino acid ABC transporter permease [Halobacteriales archaeon QS_1_68_17]|nr:MAG: branched-chain amino acid ABC transporter permease [Halobacteriales archaeon QS_1_68_17]